eukprot:gene42785-25128_t
MNPGPGPPGLSFLRATACATSAAPTYSRLVHRQDRAWMMVQASPARWATPPDPGLPPGGVSGLRRLWEVMCGDAGSPLHPQACRLHKLTYQQPLFVREEREPGGYFLIKGNERSLRLLVVARGNYPITVERASFAKKSQSHTSRCVMIRSVRPSGLASPNYNKDGGVALSFSRGKTFEVSLMKALMALNDGYSPGEVSQLLRIDSPKAQQIAAAGHISWQFKSKLRLGAPAGVLSSDDRGPGGGFLDGSKIPPAAVRKLWSHEVVVADAEVRMYRRVGLWALRDHVLPHLNDVGVPLEDAAEERRRKFDALIVALRKLIAFQAADDGEHLRTMLCVVLCGEHMMDGEDRLTNQEVLTPGQVWLHCVGDALVAVSTQCRHLLSGLYFANIQLQGASAGGPSPDKKSGKKRKKVRRKIVVRKKVTRKIKVSKEERKRRKKAAEPVFDGLPRSDDAHAMSKELGTGSGKKRKRGRKRRTKSDKSGSPEAKRAKVSKGNGVKGKAQELKAPDKGKEPHRKMKKGKKKAEPSAEKEAQRQLTRKQREAEYKEFTLRRA